MNFIKKLSFKQAEEIGIAQSEVLSPEMKREALDIIEFYSDAMHDDAECAFALTHGCLAVRIFDMGRYFFPFPYPLSDGADIGGAISDIVRYAILEEISIVFSDVGRSDIGLFLEMGYRHLDIDADTPEGDSYRVRIKTECELISDIPSVSDGEISLSALVDADAAEYGALCRDKENNRFWGYDFREDNPNASDACLLQMTRDELIRSVAVSLAVRLDASFVGEAVLHAFDGKGGADLGIRILPEYQGKGYGKRAVELLRALAENMGLVSLYARVDKENLRSRALFSSLCASSFENVGEIVFIL